MSVMSLILLVALGQQPATPPPPPPVTQPAAATATDALALQVALDRAGFSPGVLDGRSGGNTKKALEAYTRANGGAPPPIEPTAKYRITDADAAGPFEPQIPTDLVEQAKLKTLAYRTLLEGLAERYHATPALLQRLNPGATFAPGEEITVPNVDPMQLPIDPPKTETKPTAAEKKAAAQAAQQAANDKPPVTVTVEKATSSLTVTDAAGKVIMYAPVTTGSEHDPLPIGDWKVNGVGLNPTFRYNPELFWDADPTHTKAVIPAGPNNPVGLVWIDISKEHYGIHGSPEPANIGRSESHGCVRLSNWDALRLAALVKPGTPVAFRP
jgi:lipoprotein-anchoring transpeptidase ErfK/SrfK